MIAMFIEGELPFLLEHRGDNGTRDLEHTHDPKGSHMDEQQVLAGDYTICSQ